MRTTRNILGVLAIQTGLIPIIMCGCAPRMPPERIVSNIMDHDRDGDVDYEEMFVATRQASMQVA